MNQTATFILTILCFFFTANTGFAQTNITLKSNIDIGEEAADIWGYVDQNNIEYAIIGGNDSTKIFSLENPNAPIQRYAVGGTNTIWRDMKSYGDYIYSIQDIHGSDGLVIIDMSSAPATITHSFWTPTLTVGSETDQFRRAHNLYVDEDGYLYVSGSNLGNQGVFILDLFTTPGDPIYVGAADLEYSHDVYVRDSLMYTSEIYAGHFGVYDISDRGNPVLLATQVTGRSFTHNAWLSDNSEAIFTTDEKSNAYVESFDISDLNNIAKLGRFRPLASQGTGVIPHNVHVLDDYLIISYYTDGVIIVDAAQPDNLIEVGSYDTWSGASTGFHGCWGAYPFLPSGLILLSDIESGLYVLDPTYVRACYLRGEVRDINTNAVIPSVDVRILSTDLNSEKTGNFGKYATGILTPGTYDVVYDHPSYANDTVRVTLSTGETMTVTVFLGEYAGPCPPNKTLTGSLVTNAEFANEWISSDGEISAGNALELHAHDSLMLDPNFEVSLGGELLLDSDGCD